MGYAARGWRVLPVHSVRGGRCTCGNPHCTKIAKHPCIKDWTSLATTDKSETEGLFRQFPYANVGICTGGESGVFVVDLDLKDGVDGLATLSTLEARHGAIPETLEVETGSGGKHLYFRTPDASLPSRAGVDVGIDIRRFASASTTSGTRWHPSWSG